MTGTALSKRIAESQGIDAVTMYQDAAEGKESIEDTYGYQP